MARIFETRRRAKNHRLNGIVGSQRVHLLQFPYVISRLASFTSSNPVGMEHYSNLLVDEADANAVIHFEAQER